MAKQVMKPRRKAKLPQAPKMDPRHKRTLIVVADGARARFLEPSEDLRTLVPAEESDMLVPKARQPSRDLATDKPGRGFSPTRDGGRHGFEPVHDYHKLEKHKFAARLADTLDQACAARKFDRLVLVAPKRSLGELHALLSPRVQKAVSKDLTASTPAALRRALASVLPPAAIAPG